MQMSEKWQRIDKAALVWSELDFSTCSNVFGLQMSLSAMAAARDGVAGVTASRAIVYNTSNTKSPASTNHHSPLSELKKVHIPRRLIETRIHKP